MFQKLKQFKDMRDKAKTLHDKLAQEIVEGSAGFGKVKIKMNGAQTVLSCHIEDGLMEVGGNRKLEGLVVEAINDTMKKCHRAMAEKMRGENGLELPKF